MGGLGELAMAGVVGLGRSREGLVDLEKMEEGELDEAGEDGDDEGGKESAHGGAVPGGGRHGLAPFFFLFFN